jgi:hypothetical protein
MREMPPTPPGEDSTLEMKIDSAELEPAERRADKAVRAANGNVENAIAWLTDQLPTLITKEEIKEAIALLQKRLPENKS